MNSMLLDNCIEGTGYNLTCNIDTKAFAEILTTNGETFKIAEIIDDHVAYTFENVLDITISYNTTHKYYIPIKSIRLLNDESEIGGAVAFVTDYTSDEALITSKFNDECRFKKDRMNPLLIICTPTKEGYFSFGNITEQLVFDDIHYKYDIIVQPYEELNIIKVQSYGTQIRLTYPQTLNF